MNDIIALLLIGVCAGVFSGILGIGGGIIIVPSLVYFLGMSQHMAQGTSLALFMAPIGVLGVYNYYKEGLVDVKVAGIMALAFIFGSYFGSKLVIGLDPATVKKTFGVMMLLISLKLIFGK